MKNGKRVQRVPIGARPPANPQAEAWVRVGEANDLDALARGEVYTARLASWLMRIEVSLGKSIGSLLEIC
ncbi:hypothetical protein [Variovorax sp. GB1P17]|uniref:hypothetical protein n=1 Tax=Variovorax sp. GB1P17 TaxID=3443740 RepID=UPI003F45F3CA